MTPEIDKERIDELLRGTRYLPAILIVSLLLIMTSVALHILVGTDEPWIWFFTLMCIILVLYGNLSIWTTYGTLQRRGYTSMGFWQAVSVARVIGSKVKLLSPADEFLALPGAKRDVRSIVRMLLSMK